MVKQYEIHWVNLDPTIGSEIKKTRPAVVLTPNESNNHLNTILVAPMTSTLKNFPMRVVGTFDGRKGQIALDQIRCIDKSRLVNFAGKLSQEEILNLKEVLKEYLID